MLSPITPFYQNQTEAIALSTLLQNADLHLQLGHIHQSLMLSYQAAQKDNAYRQTYSVDYLRRLQLGAAFAEEVEDYPMAAHLWQQVTQQFPQDVDAWYGLGLAKANVGDFRGAEVAFNRVLQLEPGHKVRSHLVEIQRRLQG